MRWNRSTLDPRERETSSAVDLEPAPDLAAQSALALVDDALRVACSRKLFTRSEALGLLHRVESAAYVLPSGDQVVGIVNDVDQRSADRLMLPSTDLVNPLLDIRLAIVS